MKTAKRYNRWTNSDREKLKNNYVLMNNNELGILLKRTPDAVRKELNNLQLTRPKKGELNKLNKYIPKDKNIFKNLENGREKREKNRKNIDKIETKIKIINEHEKKKERPYYTNDVEKKSEKKEMVMVYVDKRTSIQAEKGKEKEALEKYKKYLEKK